MDGFDENLEPEKTSKIRGSGRLKLKVLKVLMSATGTRLSTVELYGAGAQT